MSSIRARLKGLLPSSKTLQTTNEALLMAADSDNRSTLSTSSLNLRNNGLGFLELAPGTNPVVDIIAIHGLDGHREHTWTAEKGVLWLRDLLSADVPNARILTYGYDANTRSRQCVSAETISQQADKFLKSLGRERINAPRRPIIFVAHSLGGIVLKQAFILCHNQNLGSTNQLRDILVSTHAVLFFGTPHSGVKGVDLLQTMNRLLSVYMKTTNVILQHLKENSSELENIQRLYTSASEKTQAVFFYEMYPTPLIGGKQKIIVPRHSAIIAGDRQAIEEGLQADHCQMVKFSNGEDLGYITALSYVKRLTLEATTAVEAKWSLEDAYRAIAKGEPLLPYEVPRPKDCPPVSRSYVNRTRIQALITEKLLRGPHIRHQPRCILHGLGGAGKTQLATNWIQEHQSSFTRVVMVDASSRARLEVDLELSIRSLGPEYRTMTWKDAVAYLDGKEGGWLLFLDNADSLDLDLRPYLPRSTNGAILITTRNRDCIDYAPDGAVHVGDLEESEAVELLHTISDCTPVSEEMSLEIVRELGMLALAIAQAGAYIRKTRRLYTYLDTFRRHRDQILRKQPDRGTEYTSSTYTAFDLSFQQLPAGTQELMKIFASLHHSIIPIALFEKAAESGFATCTVRRSIPPPEGDNIFITNLVEIFGPNWNQFKFQEVIDSASRASFINISTDGLSYSVHPLVQTYIKDKLGEEETRRYIRTTSQLLLGAIRPSQDSNAWYWQLLLHVNNIPRSVQSENVAHGLVFLDFYDSLGDWTPCRELSESILSQFLDTQDQRHEDSLWLIENLVKVLQGCGQLYEAEKVQRDVFNLRLEVLGGRHQDTILAMGNLALILRHCGQPAEAENIQREVLGLSLEILGEQHPDTILAMGNLALILCERGELDEAEKMQREVLVLWLETLGGRYPHTILAMNNLAVTLRNRGQLDEAEKMQREVLALQLEILGGRHPHAVTAMSNVAGILSDRGQLDDAEHMQREVLALRLEILGQHHLGTLEASYNLSVTMYKRGQLEEAVRLLQETIRLHVRVLGEDHLHTQESRELLAFVVSTQVP